MLSRATSSCRSTTFGRFTGSASADKIRRHHLGLDALGLGGVEVELDLDAVGIVEEKLEQRLPVGAALAEIDPFLLKVSDRLAQPGSAESDVIDGTRASPCALRGAPEVLLLDRARRLRARADVHDVDAVQVHPVHREAEVRMRTAG